MANPAECADIGKVTTVFTRNHLRMEADLAAQPASFLARHAPRAAALADKALSRTRATFLGHLEGDLGRIVQGGANLEGGLNQASRARTNELLKTVRESLYGTRSPRNLSGAGGALDNMRYVGPEKWTDVANGVHRDLVWASTPRSFWRNVPDQLYADLDELREVAYKSKVLAEQMGYPQSAFRDNYIHQEWEDITAAQAVFSDTGPNAGSLIGPAKERVIPNFAVGIEAGLTPTAKTVDELLANGIALWNRAAGEAWERTMVLANYGTKQAKVGITSGQRGFQSPLYRGWTADSAVAAAIDSYHRLPGKVERGALNLSARAKNVAFGTLDTAIAGVQGLKAITTGGVQLFAAEVLRGAAALRFAPARKWAQMLADEDGLSLLVRARLDGLVLSKNVGGVTVGKGTLLQYLGRFGKMIDKPLSKLIDAKANVEFGMALNFIRVELYKGNLLLLHMAGRNITDPAVRRIAADWANAMSGASRGAQTPGRKLLETAGTTSMQMMRSEVATLGGIVKAATVGTGIEKQMAMMTLASVGATVYGLGSLVNWQLGNGPVPFNPQDSKWATILIAGKNVPIIPQRGLIRAIAKSITELEKLSEADVEKLTRIWTQYVLSKGAPGTTATVTNLAGFGFDPDEGFKTGDLDAPWRFLNAAPLPPVVSSAIGGEADPASIAFGVGGFNPFPVSAIDKLKEAWKEEFPNAEDYEGGPQKVIAAANPRLAPLLEAVQAEGVESGFEGALNQEQLEAQGTQQAEAMRPLIEGVRAGNRNAGPRLLDAYSGWKTFMAGAVANSVFGVDFDDPETDAEHALNELRDLNPTDPEFMDSDPETGDFVTDWGLFSQEQDRLIARVEAEHPGYTEAYEARLRLPEEFADVEQQLKDAKLVRDGLFDIPRYTNATVEEYQEIQRLKRNTAVWFDEKREQGERVPESVSVRLRQYGTQAGVPAEIIQKAIFLNSRRQADRVRDPRYNRYLIDNAEVLLPFYPSLYSNALLTQIGRSR